MFSTVPTADSRRAVVSALTTRPAQLNNLKLFFSNKQRINFNIIWQKGPFGDPPPRLIKP